MFKFPRLLPASLILVAALGCSSKKEKSSDSSATGSSAQASDPAAATILTGSAPTLPAPLAKLAFGSSQAEALAALGQTELEWKVDDIEYSLVVKNDRVVAARVNPPSKPLETLPALWGAAATDDRGDSYWFAPATGLRAKVSKSLKHLVEFSAYQPLSQHLGTTPFGLAFAAGKPLIGATLDELKAAWGNTLCKFDKEAAEVAAIREASMDKRQFITMCWPGLRSTDGYSSNRVDSELAGMTTDLLLIGQDGRVFGYSFGTELSDDLRSAMIADLDAAFGKAEEITVDDRTIRSYFSPDKKLQAEATFTPGSVSVEVSTYLPIAELLGGDGPGLSFETPSMIGGTAAQIEAEVGRSVRVNETPDIDLPGTEYNERTKVSLKRWAKETKVHGYSTTIHFTDRPARGDQIMELIKAKFGESKPDPRSTADVPFLTFKKNGRTINVAQYDNQIFIEVEK